jgi:sulfur-oxidizing protein SoxX
MLKRTFLLTVLLGVISGLFFSPFIVAEESADADKLEKGKALTFDRFKGNCLACHYVEGGELTGNYGPPLIAMKIRYPDRDALRAQIWDASVKNPDTRMPPFGRNRILTEQEIDLITDFIQTL